MTTPVPHKLLVEPPRIDPYQYGLLQVAQVTDGAGRWEIGGVEYDTDACPEGGYVVGMCPQQPGGHDKHHPQGLDTVRGSNPFAVYVRAECNAVGFKEAAAHAERRIGLIEPRAVEEFFSREVLGRERVVRPLGDRAVSLKYALGVLEQHATSHYAGQPTFHVPRWVAPWFPSQDPADTGAVAKTKLGSRVAFGTGYLDHPDDPEVPPGPEPVPGRTRLFWLFATGTVRVWRAPVRIYEAFQERSNTRLALAEQPHAVDWDCYLAGVLVNMRSEVGK